jgi:hypothetical protein
MGLAPFFLATLAALAAESNPFTFASDLASHHRVWKNSFAFPVAYGVVWPACALSALVTWMDVLRTGERSEVRAGASKKRR